MERNELIQTSKKKMYTLREEIANSVSHGIGIVFSIVAMTILLVYGIWMKSPAAITGFAIYGVSSILLYTASTLYHSFRKEKIKRIMRVLDHSAIFLLIAGTYTPVTLIAMQGYWRVGILSTIWVIAISGIVFKVVTYNKMDRYKGVSLALYILMGWIAVIAIKPMTQTVPVGFLIWLLAGGAAYTIGTIFYAVKKIPYHHAIWHLFVLAGSVLHFLGIFRYLAVK
ncbi:PAQR family membrane homeostasis protein TrhA [Acidaminobacter sp.]|uniref:PAQR family membrane homeostasis protein TrhA n=1 Tax=Acidaminobacter sp. TaxID=1872102 RepID=UPI001382AFD4|nr:hemolysin III family protein [Acidaminobacter sp.]MDK9710004.1 hemolysin III family protein [Acidaminobacter sp.]MZQ98105.1 hemolysin III family protein [Acidaminobacter sp.]